MYRHKTREAKNDDIISRRNNDAEGEMIGTSVYIKVVL